MFKQRSGSGVFLGKIRRRVFIFSILLVGCLMLISMRLWHLQVLQHEILAGKSENNRIRQIRTDGLRGRILDRNGIPLVDSRPSFQVSLIPEDVKDMEWTLDFLEKEISIDKQAVREAIKKTRSFNKVTLKRDISRKEVAFIEERRIDLPGVFLEVKAARNYENGDMAAHILGYLGAISQKQYDKSSPEIYSRDDFIGQYGVEKVFEKTLRGGKGFKRIEVDAAGRELRNLATKHPESGKDIHLTLDYETQKAAEEAFGDKMGAAIAIDPDTGEVLAFVSKPSFNPNDFAFGIRTDNWKKLLADEFHPLQERPTQGQYPPGSTFKIIMAAAALEEGIITPETKFYCPGHYRLGKRSYRCWKKGGHGSVDVHTALVRSCDVFFYNVGIKLGINKIAEYSRKFGLGVKTGIELTGEKPGLTPTKEWKLRAKKERWIKGETVSCSIGQGFVLATPIQLARMVAMVANGGRLITPTIIKKDGQKKTKGVRTSLKKETLDIIGLALRGVVAEKHGTAWRLRKGKYTYAGKTGTAQVVKMKQNEKWEHEKMQIKHRDHAWFVSYAPFDNPKIAVAVIAEHAGHGGSMAAPVAQKIMDTYLSKLEKAGIIEPPIKDEGQKTE
ncbi:Peptidoglycan D,D-transpeptidase MrdA [hydrothermal vent metagenome]|uniref:Peptidoglycan D,D-transpeptidase MrdA n=1 Tax=hydrothermal vent metagenome TaxID=652676 RepID=A0A3B1C314_9ZZZZ